MRLPVEIALPAIYDAATSDTNWQNALDEIASASGAKSATLYANNSDMFEFGFQAASSFVASHPQVLHEYLKRFADHDLQASRHMQAAPAFKRIEDDEIWPGFAGMREREDLAFLARELGIYRRVGYNLSENPAWGAYVALQFDQRVVEFKPKWVNSSNLLVPHLGKALEVNRFCSQLRRAYQAVLTVLDRIDVALCVCLPSGEIVVKNKRTNDILEARNGIELSRSGRLRLNGGDHEAAALTYVSECGLTARGEADQRERTLIVPKRNQEEPYFVEVSPLRDGIDELNDNFSGALVMIIDPERPPRLSVKPAAKLFGLTPAESEVAELLTEGRSVNDIADMRGVSPETIRSQSKRVYDKLTARNRAEFVRRITNVSPPIVT